MHGIVGAFVSLVLGLGFGVVGFAAAWFFIRFLSVIESLTNKAIVLIAGAAACWLLVQAFVLSRPWQFLPWLTILFALAGPIWGVWLAFEVERAPRRVL